MKKALLIATIVCALIAITAYAVFALPTVQEYKGQKWEYAFLFYSRELGVAGAATPTEEEGDELNAVFAKIPNDELNPLNIHNVMGAYGWELIMVDDYEGSQNYTYKRPVQ